MRKLGEMKFDALVDAVSAADFMNPLGRRSVFGPAHQCLVIHRRARAAALAVSARAGTRWHHPPWFGAEGAPVNDCGSHPLRGFSRRPRRTAISVRADAERPVWLRGRHRRPQFCGSNAIEP
jgi:hypothetical protein